MQRGFTLIELVVILILAGILAAYAIPRSTYDFTADVASTELMQAIRFAQQQAMDKTGASASAGISIGAHGFSFTNVSTITSTWKLLNPNPEYSVDITPGDITFDGHGKPTCSSGYTCSASVQTITVTASGNTVAIYLEPYTGYVHK